MEERNGVNQDQIKNLVEIVGISAIVASLIFVGLELRQSQRIATEASIKSDAELIVAVESLVAEYPYVWLRGCRGEVLSESDQLLFSHLYHTYDYLYFLRYIQAQTGVGSVGENAAIQVMALNVHRNRGIRAEWESRWAWRPHAEAETNALIRWRDLVNERIGELEKLEPDPIQDPSRCGLS